MLLKFGIRHTSHLTKIKLSFIKLALAINEWRGELKINHEYHQYSRDLTSKLRRWWYKTRSPVKEYFSVW